jgi:hypothetical protein
MKQEIMSTLGAAPAAPIRFDAEKPAGFAPSADSASRL